MAEADELYSVKNSFWIGNYEDAITDARTVRPKNDTVKVERDCFVYRSHIGLGNYSTVIDEIKDDSSVALQSIKLLATYLDQPNRKQHALLTLDDWLADPAVNNNPTLQLMAATIYLHEQQYQAVLKTIKGATTLEQLALMAQVYLKIDRPDLAEKTVKSMQGIDDESALTQLSNAWLDLALGGEKYKEASLIFKDLSDRISPSATILNGLAVAYINMKRYDAATEVLEEAHSKNTADADTLINLIAVSHQTGKTEGAAKYLSLLREAAPNHPYIQSLTLAEGMFDRVMASYAPNT